MGTDPVTFFVTSPETVPPPLPLLAAPPPPIPPLAFAGPVGLLLLGTVPVTSLVTSPEMVPAFSGTNPVRARTSCELMPLLEPRCSLVVLELPPCWLTAVLLLAVLNDLM